MRRSDHIICSDCNGKERADWMRSNHMICDTCKGTGQQSCMGQWGPFMIQSHRPCPDCSNPAPLCGQNAPKQSNLMKCPDCNGKGGLLYEPGLIISPCDRCGGYGTINCCEGEQVHPGDESSESQRQSTTANQPTYHPSPTS